MKKRYDEFKKIMTNAQLAQVYDSIQDKTVEEGFEISTSGKENESLLGGEVILSKKDKFSTSIDFNVPNGDYNVDISTLKGVKSLLKAKKEMERMIEQMQTDYQTILSIEKHIHKHDPELLATAKEKSAIKKMKM